MHQSRKYPEHAPHQHTHAHKHIPRLCSNERVSDAATAVAVPANESEMCGIRAYSIENILRPAVRAPDPASHCAAGNSFRLCARFLRSLSLTLSLAFTPSRTTWARMHCVCVFVCVRAHTRARLTLRKTTPALYGTAAAAPPPPPSSSSLLVNNSRELEPNTQPIMLWWQIYTVLPAYAAEQTLLLWASCGGNCAGYIWKR